MSNTNSTSIDFNGISEWSKMLSSKGDLKNILQNAGNRFNFSFAGNQTADVHIYFSYDSENQELSFQVINASQDTKENKQAVAIKSTGTTKKALPDLSNIADSNPNFIDYTTASQRVNDYMNDSKRNAWLDQLFSKNLDVAQAFVVDAIDFEPGSSYDCFLGLKTLEDESQEIDLLVYNTSQSIQVGIRDMSIPIPPYKGSGALSRDKFGALDNI